MVFGIAAPKPDTINYQCDKVLCLEIDVEAHRSLELLHHLGEQACSEGRGTSFGLHTSLSSCLNLSAVAITMFFKCSALCFFPLSDIFALFCDHATCAYISKEKNLPLIAISLMNANQFEIIKLKVMKKYVLGLFDVLTMVAPHDSTRTSFCREYIRF
ncbi:hypothetical protein PanWU01x14_109590 [Parasponia andersonii]|uniref:Uncharacterized protein n=1 Tax=Parasponia andersonii TaxID=3476 RepID=A0A2P5CZU7_PARAD|nr:hypothetical protein PanWU01x14_109590 [Parasponia andersonii]